MDATPTPQDERQAMRNVATILSSQLAGEWRIDMHEPGSLAVFFETVGEFFIIYRMDRKSPYWDVRKTIKRGSSLIVTPGETYDEGEHAGIMIEMSLNDGMPYVVGAVLFLRQVTQDAILSMRSRDQLTGRDPDTLLTKAYRAWIETKQIKPDQP